MKPSRLSSCLLTASRCLKLTACCLLTTACCQAQTVTKLHHKAILIDTHNDILSSTIMDGYNISNKIERDKATWCAGKKAGSICNSFLCGPTKNPVHPRDSFMMPWPK